MHRVTTCEGGITIVPICRSRGETKVQEVERLTAVGQAGG